MAVLIPCCNEARTIGECIKSLVEGEFPRDQLELIVVDGKSTDNTRSEIARVQAEFPDVEIRVLDNPKRTATAAFNLGLSNSSAPVVALASAHSYYPPEYLRLLVEGLESTGAECVGGAVVAEAPTDGTIAQAIATVLSHPFGVGNSPMRTQLPTEPVETDAVAYGCWRRGTLEALGGFDESVFRSQDFALGDRLRRSGGRIVMIPGAWVRYVSRGTLSELVRHNLSNGFWVTFPALTAGVRFAPRHYAPLGLVVALLGGALPIRPVRRAATAAATTYVVAVLAAGVDVYRRKRSARLAAASLVVFPTVHFAYGVGSVGGLLAGARERLPGIGSKAAGPA